VSQAALWFRRSWLAHRRGLMGTAVAAMAVASVVWLSYEFWRLLWGAAPIWPGSPIGAVDLRAMHRLVHEWFAGTPVYGETAAVHPPATYVLLWPLLGWVDLTAARWLWAATTVVAGAVLVWILVRESGAETPLERTFVALLPCSIYATGAAIGNGQLIVHLLPMLLVGLLLMHRGPHDRRRQTLGSVLFLATLVKPTISAPFLWLVLVAPRSSAPVLLVALGYCVLTLFAVTFQHSPLTTLLSDWRVRSSSVAVTPGQGNVANLHLWLGSLGLEHWILPASLAVWLALGLWIQRRRHTDLWVLLGVTALVARFWTYHRWYDDALLLLPMIALFRAAKGGRSDDGGDLAAGMLLALMLIMMVAPGGLFLLPAPWNTVYLVGQIIVWILVLGFLVLRARPGSHTGALVDQR